MMKRIYIFLSVIVSAVLVGCGGGVPGEFTVTEQVADIYPDYSDVTVPPNIAPLHFMIDEEAEAYATRISYSGGEWVSSDRKVRPSVRDWRKMTEASRGGKLEVEVFVRIDGLWFRRAPFAIEVADEEIDPYLSYRLISPSYVGYKDLKLSQRNVTNFEERILYANLINHDAHTAQCINCHSYQNYNPGRMQFHVRESMGGTVIAYDGKLRKVNMKTDSLISGGVYPSWHPTKKLIAYSVNATAQTFHTTDLQKIEVQDSESDLILYDVDKNEVTRIMGRKDELEVFPWWSPDGRWLYYASAYFEVPDSLSQDDRNMKIIVGYKDVKYDLYRRSYDPETNEVGQAELVFDASGRGLSATLPRISPDGNYLLFTLGEFGVFHIWHKDSDLYLMDLRTGLVRPMREINSKDVDSYHSWSSNGRWIVFSSRRYDGNYTRPFIAYFDRNGRARKAFELPQDDPDRHRNFMLCYNIPEFMSGPVEIRPQEFASFIRNTEAERSKQVN